MPQAHLDVLQKLYNAIVGLNGTAPSRPEVARALKGITTQDLTGIPYATGTSFDQRFLRDLSNQLKVSNSAITPTNGLTSYWPQVDNWMSNLPATSWYKNPNGGLSSGGIWAIVGSTAVVALGAVYAWHKHQQNQDKHSPVNAALAGETTSSLNQGQSR